MKPASKDPLTDKRVCKTLWAALILFPTTFTPYLKHSMKLRKVLLRTQMAKRWFQRPSESQSQR